MLDIQLIYNSALVLQDNNQLNYTNKSHNSYKAHTSYNIIILPEFSFIFWTPGVLSVFWGVWRLQPLFHCALSGCVVTRHYTMHLNLGKPVFFQSKLWMIWDSIFVVCYKQWNCEKASGLYGKTVSIWGIFRKNCEYARDLPEKLWVSEGPPVGTAFPPNLQAAPHTGVWSSVLGEIP